MQFNCKRKDMKAEIAILWKTSYTQFPMSSAIIKSEQELQCTCLLEWNAETDRAGDVDDSEEKSNKFLQFVMIAAALPM